MAVSASSAFFFSTEGTREVPLVLARKGTVLLTLRKLTPAMMTGMLLTALFPGAAHAQGAPGAVPPGSTPASANTSGVNASGVEKTPQASTGTIPNAAASGSDSSDPNSAATIKADAAALKAAGDVPPLQQTVWQLQGTRVNAIRFEGVTFTASDTLPSQLQQKAGEPFDANKVRQSMRRLFSSGRYRDIRIRSVQENGGLTLIFEGVPRFYVGKITIAGVKEERLAALLEFATKLDPGTPFIEKMVAAGTDGVTQSLAQNGYFQPVVKAVTQIDTAGRQVNVIYTVTTGPQARIGNVSVQGKDPGLSEADFRKKGRLKRKAKVTRETTSDALSNLRGVYEKRNRLEASVTLQQQQYDKANKQVNYTFNADQGPLVRVAIEGTKVSNSRMRLLVPIFEEGTIDNDLLNEGSHNIREFMEQKGYFDVRVENRVIGEGTPSERVVYSVTPGERHKVGSITFKGNKYFTSETLKEHMKVTKADTYTRSGRYSPSLLTSDIASLKAVYRANGFGDTKITSTVQDIETAPNGKKLKVAEIAITITVEEGTQEQFGSVQLAGEDPAREGVLKNLMNTAGGQPFSLTTLTGDRDEILSYYLANGFDQAKIEVQQSKDPTNNSTDIVFNITEGPQVFVDKVLISGINKTRPKVVDQQLKLHAGDPLDQSALVDTQRSLYNLALFNQVNTAVQNPTGDALRKNVLVQLTEAKRWDVTYGFGFEVQTGTPSTGLYSTMQGTTAAQQGKAGISPRVSLDVSRINLRGSDNSLSFHGTYGLLEEVATATFNNPHFFGNPRLSASVTGGYSNVQDITTFQSQVLQADFRLTQKVQKTDTFLYDFQYRRVSVNSNSLEVALALVPLLSQPVRVAGPGITWYHDRRSPSPLDADKGEYTTISAFYATSKLGSQTSFSRVDGTNSTYYSFGKGKYVFARETRIGYEHAFGTNPNIGTTVCAGSLFTQNGSCNAVPLPERLYAGGGTSHRGFPINGAGPRDLTTGYPVGGAAVVVNSLELRLPPPVLPIVGDSVSFVIFHDMGNVFYNANDMFKSIKNFHQPNQDLCRVVVGVIGHCNFNYYSHALGLGARYKTPVGPVRVDFSYNLNPPIYPMFPTPSTGVPASVGQGSHFNFFFSIGQTF